MQSNHVVNIQIIPSLDLQVPTCARASLAVKSTRKSKLVTGLDLLYQQRQKSFKISQVARNFEIGSPKLDTDTSDVSARARLSVNPSLAPSFPRWRCTWRRRGTARRRLCPPSSRRWSSSAPQTCGPSTATEFYMVGWKIFLITNRNRLYQLNFWAQTYTNWAKIIEKIICFAHCPVAQSSAPSWARRPLPSWSCRSRTSSCLDQSWFSTSRFATLYRSRWRMIG